MQMDDQEGTDPFPISSQVSSTGCATCRADYQFTLERTWEPWDGHGEDVYMYTAGPSDVQITVLQRRYYRYNSMLRSDQ